MNNTNDVGQRFLRWLYEHASEHPNPGRFLDDEPQVDGQSITTTELTRAVVRAESHGMLKGHKSLGSQMPLRVRLLPPGEVCVEDFDGDMRKWEEAQRGGPTVSTGDSYTFSGVSSSQIVAGSKNVEQTQTVTVNDPELLHRLGLAAQELADLLDGKEDVHELREAATEVVRTAKDPAQPAEAGRAGQATSERPQRPSGSVRVFDDRQLPDRALRARARGPLMSGGRLGEIKLKYLECMYATPLDRSPGQGPCTPPVDWTVNGELVTPDERTRVIQSLADDCHIELANNMLFPARLTPAGRQFVEEWGDIEH